MRLFLVPLLSALVALPAAAQQLSPLTGTATTPAGRTATPRTVPPMPVTTPAPAAAAPTAAPAATGGVPAIHSRMSAHDRFIASNVTKDGKLTLDQAKAGHMRSVTKNFDAIDTAHRGYVTEDEIIAYRKAQRAARKAAKPAK